jgi:hypothetical protein
MADFQDMEWDVKFDPAFAGEAKEFARAVQLEIAALAGLLRRFGPQLRRRHCDTLKGSKHANMKELRFTLPDGEWQANGGLPLPSILSGARFCWSAAASRE